MQGNELDIGASGHGSGTVPKTRLNETARLEAFSDGVFAIATTLLIIEVHVPHATGGLGHELLRQWPSYVGYLTSFLTIGVMWINHHVVLSYVGRVDRTLLFLNTLLMTCIAFVPFPTAVLAQHIRDDGAVAAAVLYGATLTMTAIVYNRWWFYAVRDRRLIAAHVPQHELDDISRSYSFGPFIYGGAGLISFASAWAAAALYLAIAVFYLLPYSQWLRKARSRDGTEGESASS